MFAFVLLAEAITTTRCKTIKRALIVPFRLFVETRPPRSSYLGCSFLSTLGNLLAKLALCKETCKGETQHKTLDLKNLIKLLYNYLHAEEILCSSKLK